MDGILLNAYPHPLQPSPFFRFFHTIVVRKDLFVCESQLKEGNGKMGFNFRNSTSSPVYIAFGYPNSGCGPVNYAKIGWYRVDPGQTRQVRSGYVGNQTFYYYAEDAFGRRWSGPYFTDLPQQAFHWCWNTGCTTCRYLGMRSVSVPLFYFDYTVNLISTSSKGKIISRYVRNALPSKRGAISSIKKTPVNLPKKVVKGKQILKNRVSLPIRMLKKQ